MTFTPEAYPAGSCTAFENVLKVFFLLFLSISLHFSPFLNVSLVPVVFRAPKNLTFGCQVWQQSDIIPWHSFSYMLYFILQCQRKTEQVFYQLWFFSLLAVWGLYTSQGILKYLQHFFLDNSISECLFTFSPQVSLHMWYFSKIGKQHYPVKAADTFDFSLSISQWRRQHLSSLGRAAVTEL